MERKVHHYYQFFFISITAGALFFFISVEADSQKLHRNKDKVTQRKKTEKQQQEYKPSCLLTKNQAHHEPNP
jgi:hypothetical protein